MPIKNPGKGAGITYYMRNQTKHGTMNIGDVDYAPGGIFHGYTDRRKELSAHLYEAGPDGKPRVDEKGARIKASTTAGFEQFRIGVTAPRLHPGGNWKDDAGAMGALVNHPLRRLSTWVAFPDNEEGRAEFEALLAANEALYETKFDHVFVDPRVINGVQKTIRRFGFRDATAFMSDVSDRYDDIASGRMDPVVAHAQARELETVKKQSEAKDVEIEALRQKIAEHEKKLGGGRDKGGETLEDIVSPKKK